MPHEDETEKRAEVKRVCPTPEEDIVFALDEKEEDIEEEDLFSIPVFAEILDGNELEPEIMGDEKFEEELVESDNELIPSSAEIQNMEVDCELLENCLPNEEPKIEMEEEFVINDLDEKVLELEVVGPEEVEAEEENQFALDFSLPISDAEEASSEKIVHTLPMLKRRG